MTDFAEAFRQYTTSRHGSRLQEAVAELAASGNLLEPQAFRHLCADEGIVDVAGIKHELLELLFYYIRLCLADHDLTDEEMQTVRDLKRLFRIEEGDCLDADQEEVAELLAVQMLRILDDRQVDSIEALHKVRLQEVFDLGYDQFVELTRPFVEQAVAAIMEEANRTAGADIHWIHKRLIALDTVYDFDAFLDRQLAAVIDEIDKAGHPYEASVLRERSRSRDISQSVRDQVWRRDQGRCVMCGSNEYLELDHIIPFSKGGASTYRNVQLLCQDCNRRKSAAIG